MFRIALLLCGALVAAPAAAQETPASQHFWLRQYPIPEIGAHWHIDLRVKDFHKARRNILELMKKHKAEPRLPLAGTGSSPDFKYQQFSFKIVRKAATKVFKRLERMGVVRRAQQKEDNLPDYSQEISIKLGRLRAERQAGGEILRRLTAVSALAEELVGHLESVEASRLRARETVLLNIVLEEESP